MTTRTVPRTAQRSPFGTLLRVETRKLVDTRTSRIMTAVLVVVALALVVGRGVVTQAADLFTLAGTAGTAFAILLPVLGILSITGEWHHRTALTTFTLEPRRARVLVAKCVPVLVAAALACVLAVLVALPTTAVAASLAGVEAAWRLEPYELLGWMATMVLVTAQGLALGLMMLNAPAAIVIYLVNPMVWSFVGQLGEGGKAMAQWLDLNSTSGVLTSGDVTGGGLARLAVSVTAWIVVPAAVGMLRVLRSDVT
ncbi:ABC transporter permease [Nonomuraea sp. NPDC049309]|uniref:ABC transporter permease n=1 Tax=Nonomuraea sp. NPDC049309 TaxID=3364350 RepID=UPI00371BE66C